MGLTIYYRTKAKVGPDAARELVRQLHASVSKLPFDEVSQLYEYDSPDGKYAFERAEGEPPWKPGVLYLERNREDGQTDLVEVPPLHVVCFHADLQGSETASFGLASHPPVVVHRADVIIKHSENDEERRVGAGTPAEFNTRLRGWYTWQGFVKTQYAGDPRLGGAENFLRAHRSIFAAVDECKRLGMTVHIRDDANYWRHRDDQKLLTELKRWDELIAGVAGKLTDALGNKPGAVVGPIKDRPDFEHLEARGADQLAKAGKGKRTKRSPDAERPQGE
ncbi:MAG TPA: hypothetical protein VGI81_19290 [Tepidisphaeraceae bacterium]|jgi:hypothetical protein